MPDTMWNCRDRVAVGVSYFFAPSKLTRSRGLLCALISSVALWIAVPREGAWGSGFGLGIAPTMRSKLNVFWAAPVSTSPTLRGNLEPGRLKAPPPYVKTGTATVHRSQEKPSSCCRLPPTMLSTPKYCSGGTTGIAAGIDMLESGRVGACGAWDACTHVDVWMSESAKDPHIAPTMNDPNASTVLLIRSPQEGDLNCSDWAYH